MFYWYIIVSIILILTIVYFLSSPPAPAPVSLAAPPPATCITEEWGPWGPCIDNVSKRTRKVTNATPDCPEQETQSCQDCIVSEWTAWGECILKDNVYSKFRSREIITASHGVGAPCPTLENYEICLTEDISEEIDSLDFGESVGDLIIIRSTDDNSKINMELEKVSNTAGRDQLKKGMNANTILSEGENMIIFNSKVKAHYFFRVPEDGLYNIDFKVYSPSGNSDSLWVQLNDNPARSLGWGGASMPSSFKNNETKSQWVTWSSRLKETPDVDTRDIFLTAGVHKLIVSHREVMGLIKIKINKKI